MSSCVPEMFSHVHCFFELLEACDFVMSPVWRMFPGVWGSGSREHSIMQEIR
jgi:hypothetical protein